MKNPNEQPAILIVDDIETNRTMLKRFLLQKYDCRVLEAEDGDRALQLALKESPAIILMDIGLPGHGGLFVTQQMCKRRELRDVPIIAVTAYDSTGLRLEAEAAGVTDYVTKPLDLENFTRLIDQFLQPDSASK